MWVKEFARKAGITKLAPHDLRRTCARLCHAAGGELEQIQFLLGHISVQTTERYLGYKQRPYRHRAGQLMVPAIFFPLWKGCRPSWKWLGYRSKARFPLPSRASRCSFRGFQG